MGRCVRVFRGLAIVCAVLGRIAVLTAIVGVAAQDIAVAQASRSVEVVGNRRVEADTIRSYFRAGPSGQLDAVAIDDGLKALIATGLFAGCADQHVRRPPGRHSGREPGDQPGSVRGQQKGQGRATQRRSAVEAARHAVARRWCRPTSSASSRFIAAAAASTFASNRKSSSCRTIASIWFSKSPKATRPASRPSISSVTAPMRLRA